MGRGVNANPPSHGKGLNKTVKVGGLKVPLDNTHIPAQSREAQQRTSVETQQDLVSLCKGHKAEFSLELISLTWVT